MTLIAGARRGHFIRKKEITISFLRDGHLVTVQAKLKRDCPRLSIARVLPGWPLAWEAYADGMNNLPRVIAENAISDAESAQAFVEKALRIAVVTHL